MPDEKPQSNPEPGATRAERPVSGMSRPASGTGSRATDRGDEVLASGTKFGKYTIVRLIGAGGMGAVYEATHSSLRKRYAIKVLHPVYASQDDIRQRFIREGESASRINHPNVVSVTDFGVEDDTPFLVMEYLEGESLADMLERDGAVGPQKLVELMLPVCAAISAAHDEGVVHRDLKPDNVFLARRGGTKGAPEVTPKVVDFGISKMSADGGKVEASLTSTGSMVGTPHYMSPEQMRASKHVDARSDQYSFGVMLYECATGRKPFDAETLYELIQKIALGSVKKPRDIKPEIPATLEAVILKAMAHEPGGRYPTMASLGRALMPFASERTRAIWEGTFAGADEGTADAAPATPSKDTSAMGLPPSNTTRVVTIDSVPEVVFDARTGTKDKPSTLANNGREIEVDRGPKPAAPNAKPPRVALIGAGVAVLAVIVGGIAIARSHGTTTPAAAPPPPVTTASTANTHAQPNAPTTYRATIAAEPPTATIDFDGQSGGTGIASREFALDGREHTATLRAAGYVTRTVSFRDVSPPSPIRLEPDPTAQQAAPPPPTSAANGGSHAGEHGGHHAGGSHAGAGGATNTAAAQTGSGGAAPANGAAGSQAAAANNGGAHTGGNTGGSTSTVGVGTNGAVIIAP